VQLREIFVVRWSVFLLGPAGCGKTAIWKTLRHAQMELGEKTVFKPINPKVRLAACLYCEKPPACTANGSLRARCPLL
jgi:dynein heavy chain, axonemal